MRIGCDARWHAESARSLSLSNICLDSVGVARARWAGVALRSERPACLRTNEVRGVDGGVDQRHSSINTGVHLIVGAMLVVDVAGCAISIGAPAGEKVVAGLVYVARSTRGDTRIVDQHVIGVDLRVGTHDDAIAIGYSGMRTVFPDEGHRSDPKTGFRWPLGVAWTDAETGVVHELGWITTRVPQPDEVGLVHHRLLGAGCMFSRRCLGAVAGYQDRSYTEVPPDRDAIYVVRYESNKPFASVFTVTRGGQ